jgi:hypothetical protein
MPEKLRVLDKGKHRRSFWSRYHWELSVGAAGFVAMNLIFFARAFRGPGPIDANAASQLGEFVGGYVGTAIGLVSVLLLIVTLRNQTESARQTNFENKYFILLRMHRANVGELRLGKSAGRKVFVLMLRELRAVIPIVREIARATEQNFADCQVMNVAYYCLFYGVGPNSSRMLRASLAGLEAKFVDILLVRLDDADTKRLTRAALRLGYVPFEGHQSRLGHYYRHLYQTIRYIDSQSTNIDRYEYAKTVRAQLSTHEQALLLINSRTPVGRRWWDDRFIIDYRLVQNIPHNFLTKEEADMGVFPDKYFEWDAG